MATLCLIGEAEEVLTFRGTETVDPSMPFTPTDQILLLSPLSTSSHSFHIWLALSKLGFSRLSTRAVPNRANCAKIKPFKKLLHLRQADFKSGGGVQQHHPAHPGLYMDD